MRLNIAIKPEKELADYAVKFSDGLSIYGESLFILDGHNFLPHITIYSPEFPESATEEILEEVGLLSKSIYLFTASFSKWDPEDGFVGINLEKTEELISLHQKVLKSVNEFRNGLLRDKYQDTLYLSSLSLVKQKNIKKWGYPNVLDQWDPHMSLIRYKNERLADKVCSEYIWEFPSLVVKTIGVYKMGPNGTCNECIKEFKLLSR